MKKSVQALAVLVAAGLTATAFGQDTTTGGLDLLGALGPIGGILLAVALFFWAQWGGFRLFTGSF